MAVTRTLTVVACMVLAGASAAWAGPVQREQVAGTARWVVHMDVTAFLASPIGQYAVAKGRERGLEKKLAECRSKFGFDPLTDLRAVTLYGEGCDGADGVAIVNAKVDRNKLLKVLAENQGHQEQAWGSYVVHRWTEKPKGPGDTGERFGVFYRDDLVVIARRLEGLKRAVDVLNGKVPNLVKAGSALLPVMPAGTFLSAAGANLVPPAKAHHGMMLRGITGGWMAVGQDGANLFAKCDMTARSEADAARLQAVIRGLIAMAELACEQPAEPAATPASAATPARPNMAALLKGIRLAAAGLTVHVESATSQKDFTDFLDQAIKAHKAAWEARKARAQAAKVKTPPSK